MLTVSQVIAKADLAFATIMTAEFGTFDNLIASVDREDGGLAGEVEQLDRAARTIDTYLGSFTIDAEDLMLYAEHEEVETTWYDYVESSRYLGSNKV